MILPVLVAASGSQLMPRKLLPVWTSTVASTAMTCSGPLLWSPLRLRGYAKQSASDWTSASHRRFEHRHRPLRGLLPGEPARPLEATSA
jgi:hypothetical protein